MRVPSAPLPYLPAQAGRPRGWMNRADPGETGALIAVIRRAGAGCRDLAHQHPAAPPPRAAHRIVRRTL
ncbi:hypothetical protein A7D17_04700 [Xanthomonas floridensis]|uniref:Uncharacterized protein n=1 Tax=Xanthomonas floridensis TaxID=1843580 RepID=A0A1A9M845_9XANT|nr:hypothetical protein A7D17_04700 [Xanthomonas floridensis]